MDANKKPLLKTAVWAVTFVVFALVAAGG